MRLSFTSFSLLSLLSFLSLTSHAYPELHKRISAARAYMCAIDKNDLVRCWGGSAQSRVPQDLGKVKSLASGYGTTCAITMSDQVRCWSLFSNDKAAQVPADLGKVQSVAVGYSHACALTMDGSVKCWADSGIEKLKSPLGKIKAIGAGVNHTCAVNMKDRVTCWNMVGAVEKFQYNKLKFFTSWGNGHCAIEENNEFFCHGSWEANSLKGKMKYIAISPYHACGIDLDDKLQCAGTKKWGATNIPEALGKVKATYLGAFHSCALDMKNKLWCWGDEDAGLGQSTVPADLEL